MQFTIGDTVFKDNSPLLMGVLNVTPDSFSDGGWYIDKKHALIHALNMVRDGADIIDIGGESSRPGAEAVSIAEELQRVIPVIKSISDEINTPISVDTCKAEVAKEAIQAGASIVNDISALSFDDSMCDVLAESGSSLVLMHMKGKPGTMQKSPQYEDVLAEVFAFLNDRIEFAISRGIDKSKIIVDPGIGFGKTLDHNLALLSGIARFHECGCPVLVGVSRKSMIGMISGAEVNERVWGTAAITAHCIGKDIEIHRVHDIREMRQVADVAVALRRASRTGAGG